MAKRMSKAESQCLTLIIMIAIPFYIASKLVETLGWPLIITIAVGSLAAIIAIQIYRNKKRRAYLWAKYQDDDLVKSIMDQSFWQGQTSEQLLDSLGKPSDIDEKVLKTKKKEIWKYQHRGGNRYGLRITLDNDEVVGWDQKN